MNEIIEKVRRDMRDLSVHISEAEAALTKAVDHIASRAPTSPLLKFLTTLRDHTRTVATTLSETSKEMIGSAKVDA